MLKKYRFYIVVGLLSIAALILLFNEALAIGVILLGISVFAIGTWELLLKEKVRQFESLNQKLLEVQTENEQLKDSVEDYSQRKLNISEINTVLELGLFEVKTNFKRTVNRKLKVNDKNIQFIGVIDVGFTAKYGVDFRKIRFKIDESAKELFLSNANPEFLAFTKRTSRWEIDEILEFNIPFLGAGHWRTNPKLDKLANEIKEEIRLQVEKDSENGPEELKWIIEPLRNHVERALQLVLGAQGYRIRITDLDNNGYQSFKDYVNNNSGREIDKSRISQITPTKTKQQ